VIPPRSVGRVSLVSKKMSKEERAFNLSPKNRSPKKGPQGNFGSGGKENAGSFTPRGTEDVGVPGLGKCVPKGFVETGNDSSKSKGLKGKRQRHSVWKGEKGPGRRKGYPEKSRRL